MNKLQLLPFTLVFSPDAFHKLCNPLGHNSGSALSSIVVNKLQITFK